MARASARASTRRGGGSRGSGGGVTRPGTIPSVQAPGATGLAGWVGGRYEDAIPAHLTPEVLRDLRGRLGLTQQVMADVVGVSLRQWCAVEAGRDAATASTRRRVAEAVRLLAALATLFGMRLGGSDGESPGRLPGATGIDEDSAARFAAWMSSENPAFAGLKPIEVIERGRSDLLWAMVHRVSGG